MFKSQKKRLVEGMSAVISAVKFGSSFRDFVGYYDLSSRVFPFGMNPSDLENDLANIVCDMPPSMQWRVIDYCSAISRLYALYEQFIEETLSSWIEVRQSGLKYNELPVDIQESYQAGFSHIVSSLKKTRYSHLSLDALVNSYSNALNGDVNYRIYPECLTYHQNNLRMKEIREIFSRCGISEIDGWISNNSALKAHFGTDKRIVDLVSSSLEDFVQRRNDCAHGAVSVDDILSVELLINLSEFINAFCESILQLYNDRLISAYALNDVVAKVGYVKEKYSNGRVVAILENTTLSRRECVFVKSKGGCQFLEIISIRDNDEDVERINVVNPKEVGFQFHDVVGKKSEIYQVNDGSILYQR